MKCNSWVQCPKCGHKLFAMKSELGNANLEIKCSSCKAIVHIRIRGDGYEATLKKLDMEEVSNL